MAMSETYRPGQVYKSSTNPTMGEFAVSLESQATRMELSGFRKEADELRAWAVELRVKSSHFAILDK
jgi:hypothetical protein